MEDKEILDLYWARSENAISETENKYGRYCHYIAFNILHNHEDSEECVNDTCLRAWEVIPPQRPNRLSAFLGKITRNLALDRYKYDNRDKRGGSQLPLVYEELEAFISVSDPVQNMIDETVLTDCLNRFLASLPSEKRNLFLRRYWHFSSISDIAKDFSISEGKVKMTLHRVRNDLRQFLEKEGAL
ncbi:MAG: RNA polymerase sigma factor [Methanocorpusculum sp.]|nr:RNA polymerase sigma factor [Oscillospiraceae bacterium]MBQ3569771.1 RNA polymerase sigma factor [Methanocorpusculum sp.]